MNLIPVKENNNIYLIKEQGNNKYYICDIYGNNLFYLACVNNEFEIYELPNDILLEDIKFMSFNELIRNYLPSYQATYYPSIINEFIESYNEPIDFYILIKIFEKYGFDFVGEQNYQGKGIRLELEGNGDFQSMLEEIKQKAKLPENILDGGQGQYRYAPELKRKSIIVLGYYE